MNTSQVVSASHAAPALLIALPLRRPERGVVPVDKESIPLKIIMTHNLEFGDQPSTNFAVNGGLDFGVTVLIGYYDYHPVTKSPKIGSCDYSQMSF